MKKTETDNTDYDLELELATISHTDRLKDLTDQLLQSLQELHASAYEYRERRINSKIS